MSDRYKWKKPGAYGRKKNAQSFALWRGLANLGSLIWTGKPMDAPKPKKNTTVGGVSQPKEIKPKKK